MSNRVEQVKKIQAEAAQRASELGVKKREAFARAQEIGAQIVATKKCGCSQCSHCKKKTGS